MRALEWNGTEFKLIDQTRLPHTVDYIVTQDYREIMQAIRRLAVRGAPAIGIAAAFALAFGARDIHAASIPEFLEQLHRIASEIRATRPTAVNLNWALQRLLSVAGSFTGDLDELPPRLLAEAEAVWYEDIAMCREIGRHGSLLIPDTCTILTHCNTGALATGDFGTAQSVIAVAVSQGKKIKVYADETRPLFQGARLTMFELMSLGIDATLITDSTAAFLMQRKLVDIVLTGADRIAANGDTANKIGTYALAVSARHHGLPFLIAAPSSTIDPDCPSGASIPIEERDPREITEPFGTPLAPAGARVYAPAFDITPGNMITAIITERGILSPPFGKNLRDPSSRKGVAAAE